MDAKGRIRQELHGMKWESAVKAMVPETSIGVFDGQFHRAFFPDAVLYTPKGAQRMPNAHVSDRDLRITGRFIQLLPIRLVFRPFDESAGVFDRKKLVLAEGQQVEKGFPYLAVRQAGATVRERPMPGMEVPIQQEHTVWVDPERAFVPVRYVHTRGVARTQEVEIQYSQDKKSGWIPVSWRLMLFDSNGSLVCGISTKVTESQVNQPLPETTFQVALPPGTWVHDYAKKETYILREGGKRRPVLPGEFDGTNYEQLLHSEPPARR